MFKKENTCDCVVDVADQIDRLHLDGGECISATGPFSIFSSGGWHFPDRNESAKAANCEIGCCVADI